MDTIKVGDSVHCGNTEDTGKVIYIFKVGGVPTSAEVLFLDPLNTFTYDLKNLSLVKKRSFNLKTKVLF